MRGTRERIERAELIRYLEGDLGASEMERLRERLLADSELRDRLQRLEQMQKAMMLSKADSFAPYFADRVMHRIKAAGLGDPAYGLYESLRWAFARTAVAGFAVAGALGAYNLIQFRSFGLITSALEAVFGLPSVSFADALSAG